MWTILSTFLVFGYISVLLLLPPRVRPLSLVHFASHYIGDAREGDYGATGEFA